MVCARPTDLGNQFADEAAVGGMGKEFRGVGRPGGMAESGSDFGQGCEDEIAQEHARMGNLEVGRIDDVVAVEKDVEIDEARAFGEGFFAAHLRFDVAEGSEELRSREVSLRFEDGVKEPGLVKVIDGFGFVDAGEF